MAHGFVAGFVKYDGKWFGQWVQVDQHRQSRLEALQEAMGELQIRLQDRTAGPVVAGYKMVVIDGLCPDGREFIEDLFAMMKKVDDV